MDMKKLFQPTLRKVIIAIILFLVFNQIFSFVFFEAVEAGYRGDAFIGLIYEFILIAVSPFGYVLFGVLFGLVDLVGGYAGIIGTIIRYILEILDFLWVYLIVSLIDSRLKK
ncbi:MAG: hypothetical protein NUV57_01090 [archaeon]|nr:hypothetical protein [archaeon]